MDADTDRKWYFESLKLGQEVQQLRVELEAAERLNNTKDLNSEKLRVQLEISEDLLISKEREIEKLRFELDIAKKLHISKDQEDEKDADNSHLELTLRLFPDDVQSGDLAGYLKGTPDSILSVVPTCQYLKLQAPKVIDSIDNGKLMEEAEDNNEEAEEDVAIVDRLKVETLKESIPRNEAQGTSLAGYGANVQEPVHKAPKEPVHKAWEELTMREKLEKVVVKKPDNRPEKVKKKYTVAYREAATRSLKATSIKKAERRFDKEDFNF